MKTEQHLIAYKRKLREVKDFAKDVMFTRMVMQNIADLIPLDRLKMEKTYWHAGVTIRPKVNEEGKEIPFPPDEFDKLIGRLARAFNNEPTLTIDKDKMDGTFWLYPKMLNEWHQSVIVEVIIGNTEACDIDYVEEVVKVPKLTGFCKALAEKKYIVKEPVNV